MDAYLDALLREIQSSQQGLPIRSIYLGGGTPSQLGIDRLTQLLQYVMNHYAVNPEAEITVEVNPDDVTPDFISALLIEGVNRISMGVQSFVDVELAAISRRHTAQQADKAVLCCVENGIRNVSIDLIYGLPGQTLASFRESVDHALSLPIRHLSSYALSIEPGTPLYNRRQKGEVVEISDEQSWQMYECLRSKCREAGFHHYEISNFALPGYEALHNSSYWAGIPYLGLGPGAHGYDGESVRRVNTPDLVTYVSAPAVSYTEEHLSEDERYDELVFTRLRTSAGLRLDEVPIDRRDYLLAMADKHIKEGRLSLMDNRLCLTEKGLFVSDDIFSDLMAE